MAKKSRAEYGPRCGSIAYCVFGDVAAQSAMNHPACSPFGFIAIRSGGFISMNFPVFPSSVAIASPNRNARASSFVIGYAHGWGGMPLLLMSARTGTVNHCG